MKRRGAVTENDKKRGREGVKGRIEGRGSDGKDEGGWQHINAF